MKRLIRAFHFFQPDIAVIWLALGLMLFSTGVNLLKPWPLALIVDSLLGTKPLPAWPEGMQSWSKPLLLGLLSAAIVLLHILHGGISAGHNYLSIKIGLRGLARVRNEVFQWLQRLSLRFHQGANQGDVIYRASWDTYAFQTLFQQGLFKSAQSILSLALMIAVMWHVNARLTLWSLAALPLLLLTMMAFGAQMRRRSLAAHQADSEVTSLVQQTIVALPIIQSYTREPDEEKRFAAQTNVSFAKRISQHGFEVLYWFAVALVFGLGTGAITWFGAREVLDGRLSTGELLIFLAYLAQLYEPLNQLSHVGSTVTDANAGIQRVFELLDTQDEVQESPRARLIASPSRTGKKPPASDGSASESVPGKSSPLAVFGNLSFEKVSFSYRKDCPVLRDVSFSLSAGESLAIIGPSGSGKTTLIQLLPRFYDPTNGAVRLEGIDLRDLRLRDLRAQISLVFQEPILLRGTVAENIAYGKPLASQKEIEAAATAANADEFIRRLPESYQTIVGESGARLSVGEKQRLNLARAFLKDAPIVVLDEPTSALDAESEALVIEALTELLRNRTSLIVAHRLATIRRAHRIVVLEAGRVTELGTREELTRRPGYFARVARAQENLQQA